MSDIGIKGLQKFMQDGWKSHQAANAAILEAQLRAKKKNIVKGYDNMGVSLSNQGKFGEAIAYFDKALEIDQNYSDSWFNKATALYLLDMYKESNDCFDKLLSLEPDNALGWLLAGINFDKMGNHRDAIELYKKALYFDPDIIGKADIDPTFKIILN